MNIRTKLVRVLVKQTHYLLQRTNKLQYTLFVIKPAKISIMDHSKITHVSDPKAFNTVYTCAGNKNL